jgi:alkylation response protein AidB-like acyl-CoA dehydrogenase
MWRALAEAGILGIAVPESYGGTELGLLEMALVQERLAEDGVPLLLLLEFRTLIVQRFSTPIQPPTLEMRHFILIPVWRFRRTY